jgi:bifunctional non-homologous end joining protein LigD
MGLKEYQAKRNFRRTPEPAGKVRSRRDVPLSFVIQKHAASHLHYDFRLEMEGVLKSWAVPKGLPLRQGERRLAIEVEDHPLEYGGFEGTIAPGNYGAGTVMVWDVGTYQVLGGDPIGALHAGKIHFVMKGKKLKGEWTLVRMRDGQGSKPQWLLLKTRDDLPALSARAENRSALTGRSLEEIAGAKKRHEWVSNRALDTRTSVRHLSRFASDLSTVRPRAVPRAGVAAHRKRVQRTSKAHHSAAEIAALSGLPADHPHFIEPMRAQLVSQLPKGKEWLYEIKFDGVRALALKKAIHPNLTSRSGKDLGAKYPAILEAVSSIPANEAVLDGEVVAVDKQGRSAFQLLQSFQTSGSKPALFYYVFDILQLDGRSLLALPLWQRKALAKKLTEGIHPKLRFSDSIQANSARLVKAMRARGLEGLVGKKRDSAYEPGRRSGAWIKLKWTNEQEFVIGGYTRPRGARSHFGAILVGYYEGDKLRFAAKVGTGFNEAALRLLYNKFRKLAATDCPFRDLPEQRSDSAGGLSRAEMKRCSWVRPVLICQVRFAEWTRDCHLRQPAYLGLRDDKDPRAVFREHSAVPDKGGRA